MIAKGNLHAHGVKLAAYLVTGKAGERGELALMEGFGASDLRDAFRDVEIQARATDAQYPFFHLYTRFAPGEMLDSEQGRATCLEIVRREIEALGFAGQPYGVGFQIDKATGELHVHAGVSRIARTEDGQFFAIDPGLYKNKLKEISRECERDYGLRIISSERQPGDRARYADRNEFEESRRLDTDLKAIRNGILDCFEKSDNGKSFAAAIKAHGWEVAPGDRRDTFVVIDHAGGHHALNKKLTGKPLAEIRSRLADLDRSQLPSVEQAKERQAERAAREALQEQKHGRGADAPAPANTRTDGPERGPQPEIKPLGQTAGEIRLAWSLSRSAADFASGLEDRGLILVYVTAEEARDSERAHAFAKAIDHQNRSLKEGFAVVDGRGNVTRIDQRTTGDLREEIDKRLGGIDRSQLLGVTDAKEAMREANRAAWAEQQRDKRESERPATAIETKIAEALKATMTGHEFAEALDKAGLTITRASAGDVQALEALRYDDQLAGSAGLEATGRHFAQLEQGDFAAVTRRGDVFRLNPRKLDFEEIEQRLADVQPRMASVTEARAHNEIKREETIEHWAEIRAENTARRVANSEARDADREIRDAAAEVQRDKQETLHTAEQAIDAGARAMSGFFSGVAKAAENLLSGILSFFGAAEPKLTREQAELAAQAAEERAEARADAAGKQEYEEARDWEIFARDRRQQEEELDRKLGRGEDGGRERERERDQ